MQILLADSLRSMSSENLLTVAELAQQLRVSKNTAYSLCRDGHIAAIKVGRQWRIPQASLDKYLSKQNDAPSPHLGGNEDPHAQILPYDRTKG